MKILDNLILIPWILGFLNLSAPFSNFYFFWIVTVTFYGLLFVHLIECIVYKEKIMNAFSTINEKIGDKLERYFINKFIICF